MAPKGPQSVVRKMSGAAAQWMNVKEFSDASHSKENRLGFDTKSVTVIPSKKNTAEHNFKRYVIWFTWARRGWSPVVIAHVLYSLESQIMQEKTLPIALGTMLCALFVSNSAQASSLPYNRLQATGKVHCLRLQVVELMTGLADNRHSPELSYIKGG